MSARVLRWTVPIDGMAHQIGGGDVVLVDQRLVDAENEISVWTLELPATPAFPRQVSVFGTYEPLDARHRHIGSVVTAWPADPHTRNTLVWHVFEVHEGGES